MSAISDEAAVDNVVDVTGSVVRTTFKEVASTVVASTVKRMLRNGYISHL